MSLKGARILDRRLGLFGLSSFLASVVSAAYVTRLAERGNILARYGTHRSRILLRLKRKDELSITRRKIITSTYRSGIRCRRRLAFLGGLLNDRVRTHRLEVGLWRTNLSFHFFLSSFLRVFEARMNKRLEENEMKEEKPTGAGSSTLAGSAAGVASGAEVVSSGFTSGAGVVSAGADIMI